MRQAELRAAQDAATLQAKRLTTLHMIDRGILAAESVRDIAVGALSRIRELVPCERAGIGLFDWEAQDCISYAAEVDTNEIDTTGTHFPIAEMGEMLRAIEGGSPFLNHDLALSNEIPRVLEAFRDRGIRSSLQVPLAGDGTLVGVLSLMAWRPNAFGPAEVDVATEVAAQLAIAIEQQRLRDVEISRTVELQELVAELKASQSHRAELLRRLVDAHEEERRVIAAAVHDDAIQKMAVVVMRLDMLAMENPGMSGAALGELRKSVQESIDELRGLMFELHPYALDTDGLATALRLFLKEQARHGEVPTYELDARMAHEPPPEMRATLFRIAQEAVRNARKHAHAGTVTITLDEVGDGYRLAITDDGAGFDADAIAESPPGHLGLTAMRERAEIVGGWRRVISQPGAGTTIQAWVPGPIAYADGP
jgi:signal transduction histidine kinase